MSKNKTVPTAGDVDAFIEAVESDQKREDAKTLLTMFRRLSGHDPKMWGPSIIGFGSYHYKYNSGREGDMALTGFSPRKSALTLYVMAGFEKRPDLMKKLGKHKVGKSCLYVNRLADIDLEVLEELITADIDYMRSHYDTT